MKNINKKKKKIKNKKQKTKTLVWKLHENVSETIGWFLGYTLRKDVNIPAHLLKSKPTSLTSRII